MEVLPYFTKTLFAIFIVQQFQFSTTQNAPVSKSLTESQLASFKKFKETVLPILPHEHAYMKMDFFLLKWLQDQSYSVRKAEKTLKEALVWRRDNVDVWKDSDFAEFKQDYPVYIDSYDKQGRPVLEGFFGDWNLRKVALSGNIRKFTYYVLSHLEKLTVSVGEFQSQGKNVTDWWIIANMDGFSITNQACPTCLQFFLGYITYYQKYWPLMCSRILLINTPASFETVIKLVRPIMTLSTRDSLKVFGANKAQWEPFMLELLDPEEMSDWYGGKKTAYVIFMRVKNSQLFNCIVVVYLTEQILIKCV